MRSIAIIPARYGSTRFPGKPLARLGDRPLIQWAYTAARRVFDDVYVATDDPRILRAVEGFGGHAVLTSSDHPNGTSRVCEAVNLLGVNADIVVNLQGDEPFLESDHLLALMRCFDIPDTSIATLVTPFDKTLPFDALFDFNRVKVVMDNMSNAMYFTRTVVPFVRSRTYQYWLQTAPYFGHIGIYAYRREVLDRIVALPPSVLEQAESLEQLRWLQNGYKVRCAVVSATHIGIDTPEDLIHANEYLSKLSTNQ